ncbi:nitrous oxide reductase accessory protein NosL [Halobaculum halobium]|uniref:Nitrous oxide reductase accessory protein NosL n=1 Tax=Halobaculum halobium TaxID=3032281 RepID=A0ABD5T607_9EURY|nr:nitrous oxide reductase accessory protein NosL [Halobaculum sp. SYNS20]
MVSRNSAGDGDNLGEERTHESLSDGSVSRRTVLSGAVAAGVVSIAGCAGTGGGGADSAPDAVTLSEDATCDVCGMVISKHPGPSSEAFYEDQEPNGHANPARFDSTWEAFQFDYEREGWTRTSFYVTDYSAVDYEIRTDGDQQLISRHVEASTFVSADSVTFVADSAVVGTMGADLIGFSEQADAEAFRSEYGGELVTADEVTKTLIGQLGK